MKTLSKILGHIGTFILGMLAISVWYGCETATTNHTNHNPTIINPQVCSIFGDRREITDTIYLHDNGRHVDIIIPDKDTYTGYGWGSEEFYLHVPTWDDLKYRNIYNATKKDNKVLMHYKENLVKMDDWVAIPITKPQWNDLHQNIHASFDTDSTGAWQYVADGYKGNDTFYKAHGEYSYYYTCNSWTNEMLKKSDIYARKHALFSEEVINIHR